MKTRKKQARADDSAGRVKNQTSNQAGKPGVRLVKCLFPKAVLPLVEQAASFNGESLSEFIMDAVRAKVAAVKDDMESVKKLDREGDFQSQSMQVMEAIDNAIHFAKTKEDKERLKIVSDLTQRLIRIGADLPIARASIPAKGLKVGYGKVLELETAVASVSALLHYMSEQLRHDEEGTGGEGMGGVACGIKNIARDVREKLQRCFELIANEQPAR